MPIKQYICQTCGNEYEELVSVNGTAPCPVCKSANVRQTFFGLCYAPSGGSSPATARPHKCSKGNCSGCPGCKCK